MKPQKQQGMFKKVRSARPQALWRAERMGVREHGKGPRTPLTPFFNIPTFGKAGREFWRHYCAKKIPAEG